MIGFRLSGCGLVDIPISPTSKNAAKPHRRLEIGRDGKINRINATTDPAKRLVIAPRMKSMAKNRNNYS